MKFKRIAIDTSKHVFTLHGVDEQEQPVLRREYKLSQVEAFFNKLPTTEVVLEACGVCGCPPPVLQEDFSIILRLALVSVVCQACFVALYMPWPVCSSRNRDHIGSESLMLEPRDWFTPF